MFINFDNRKSGIVVGIVLVFITYNWISFKFSWSLIQFWLIGVFLSFAIAFILSRTFKFWKGPIVIIALDLIYHLYSAIQLYFSHNSITEPIYHTPYLQALQYTFGGDNRMTFIFAEIPFVVLTISFTLGIYILNKIKIEIRETD